MLNLLCHETYNQVGAGVGRRRQHAAMKGRLFQLCFKLCCYCLEQPDSLPERFYVNLFWCMKEV